MQYIPSILHCKLSHQSQGCASSQKNSSNQGESNRESRRTPPFDGKYFVDFLRVIYRAKMHVIPMTNAIFSVLLHVQSQILHLENFVQNLLLYIVFFKNFWYFLIEFINEINKPFHGSMFCQAKAHDSKDLLLLLSPFSRILLIFCYL